MYQLFYMPARASLAPHIVLQELQLPYELKLVDFSEGGQSDPEFLAINPNGRVPALVWDGFPMYESAAITMYLADKQQDPRLAPDLQDKNRPLYYQWMSYLSTTIQETLNQWFHPDEFIVDEGPHAEFRKYAEQRLEKMWRVAHETLSGSEYLLGEKFSACDAYMFMLLCWQYELPFTPEKWPVIDSYFWKIRRRPSVVRTLEAEGVPEWWSDKL
ncbi:MAG: glutathione S-transferase N-terminal domain-containing protein [Gammaproteobacteria bacterium]|nr:glutathione S-transferase N-terminal domain-containing protein [Gammaproteobacteria bacterium]